MEILQNYWALAYSTAYNSLFVDCTRIRRLVNIAHDCEIIREPARDSWKAELAKE